MKLISEHLDALRVEAIAHENGVTAYNVSGRIRRDGRHEVSFLLRPVSDERRMIRQANYTKSGERRVWAVCWHGHYVVMRDIFNADPDAVLRTALATYDGRSGFHRNAWPTGGKNIGSQMFPQPYETACHCEDGAELEHEARNEGGLPSNESNGVVTTLMNQSDIRACPHFIMVPEHYRADGSCRCDDPNANEMAEWGYVWNPLLREWDVPAHERD